MHTFLALLAVVLWLFAWYVTWDYPLRKGLEDIRPAAARTPPRNRHLVWPLTELLIAFCTFVAGIAALFIGFDAGQVAAWVFAAGFFGTAFWLGRRLGRRWGHIHGHNGWTEATVHIMGVIACAAIAILILAVSL